MKAKNEKIYDKLPAVYEFLMRKVSYQTWAHYLDSLISEYVSNNGKVLELAAGNCKLANYLVKFYPNIIATDISKNMLYRDNNSSIPKVCCDMSMLPFKNNFDLVYSTFDSINYLKSKKLLLRLFKEVRSVLKDDGIFTFDVSMERNSLIHIKVPERKGSYQGVRFFQRSKYNPNSRIHTNTFKLIFNNGEKYSEVHKQKIFSFETYFDILERAGLYVVRCYDSFTYKNGSSDSERLQFLTKKIRTKC